jgi:hypothetical protein
VCVSTCVRHRNLNTEVALARFGLLCFRSKSKSIFKCLCNIKCVIYTKYAVVVTFFLRNGLHVLASAIYCCFYTATLHFCESISLTVLGRFAVSFHTSVQGPMVCLNGSLALSPPSFASVIFYGTDCRNYKAQRWSALKCHHFPTQFY